MRGTSFTSGIHWDGRHFSYRGPQGQPVPVPREAEVILGSFLDLFWMKFRRDPTPGEPVVFDPTKSTPTPMPIEDLEESMRAVLIEMGTHPAHRYAREQLGYVVSEDNVYQTSVEHIARWNDAVREWCDAHPEVEPPPPTVASILPARVVVLRDLAKMVEQFVHDEQTATALGVLEDLEAGCRELVRVVSDLAAEVSSEAR